VSFWKDLDEDIRHGIPGLINNLEALGCELSLDAFLFGAWSLDCLPASGPIIQVIA
jgi:hypothetical protein